eukprot:g921.t1
MNHIPTKLLAFLGGSAAWRANATSALVATTAAVLLYLSIELWTRGTRFHSHSAAAGAAVLYAVSPLIWLYAISSEVFSLNNLFATMIIYLTVRHVRIGNESDVYWGAFVCGLALTNQHTIVLFEIPLIASVLFREYADKRGRLSASMLGRASLAFIAGLALYAYLPISAYVWDDGGGWGDLRTIGGFFRHLRRADYGTFELYSGNKSGQDVEGLLRRIELYVGDVVSKQTLAIGILPSLALVGSLRATAPRFYRSLSERASWQSQQKRRNRKAMKNESAGHETSFIFAGRALLSAYVFYMLVFHSLSNLPLDEGLLLREIATLTLFSLATAVQVSRWIPELDMRHAPHVEMYGRALLDPLPRGAILLTAYDVQWTVARYLQECEGFRTDVVLMSQPMMSYTWFAKHQRPYAVAGVVFPGTHLVSGAHKRGIQRDSDDIVASLPFTISEFIEANLDHTSGVFIGGGVQKTDERYLSAAYDQVYVGLSFQSLPVEHPKYTSLTMSATKYYNALQNSWTIVRDLISHLPNERQFHDETWEWMIARDYWAKAGKATRMLAHLATTASTSDASYGVNLALSARVGEEVLASESRRELDRFSLTAGLLKNTGLAYIKLVQGRVKLPETMDLFRPLTFFSSSETRHIHFDETYEKLFADAQTWQSKAAIRALELWSEFLSTRGARSDAQYETIAKTVAVLRQSTTLQYIVQKNEMPETSGTRIQIGQNEKLKAKTGLSVHAGANLINTYYDFVKGADVHGSSDDRTLVDKTMRPNEVRWLGIMLFGLATLLASALSIRAAGMPLFVLYAIGAALAFFYTADPYSLKYKGFGDICVFLCFGPLLGAGVSLALGGGINRVVLLFSVAIGCLVEGVLHANNVRDIASDRRAGIQTLAQSLTKDQNAELYTACLAVPYAIVVCTALYQRHDDPSHGPGLRPLVVLATAPWARYLFHCFATGELHELPQKTAQFSLMFGVVLIGSLSSPLFFGRFLLGQLFYLGGVNNILQWKYNAALVHMKLNNVMPGLIKPITTIMFATAVTLQLIASVTFVLGFAPRLSAWVLLTFLVPVTFFVHDMWVIRDEKTTAQRVARPVVNASDYRVVRRCLRNFPTDFDNEFVHFFKNAQIMGGLVLYLVLTDEGGDGSGSNVDSSLPYFF